MPQTEQYDKCADQLARDISAEVGRNVRAGTDQYFIPDFDHLVDTMWDFRREQALASNARRAGLPTEVVRAREAVAREKRLVFARTYKSYDDKYGLAVIQN